MKKHFTQLIGILFIVSIHACGSPYKSLENGDYHSALDRAITKIKGKKKKKTEYVEAIEIAYAKLRKQELQNADALRKSDRAGDWEKAHESYKNIHDAQHKIEPLLPLFSSTGYEARFKFVKIRPLLAESKNRAVHLYYEESLRYLEKARNGDKKSARESYHKITKIERFIESYEDSRAIKDEALNLGKVHVQISIQNTSPSIVNRRLENEMMEHSPENFNRNKWIQYHGSDSEIIADYLVHVDIRHLEVTPELLREEILAQEREIEDGREYVLDENGNVAKDSLGNDITRTRYMIVQADVIQTQQTKSAHISARIHFIDNQNGLQLKYKDISTDQVFENYYSTCVGDPRAVDESAKIYLDDRFVPFPSDEQMIYDSMEAMKHILAEYLDENQHLFKI